MSSPPKAHLGRCRLGRRQRPQSAVPIGPRVRTDLGTATKVEIHCEVLINHLRSPLLVQIAMVIVIELAFERRAQTVEVGFVVNVLVFC